MKPTTDPEAMSARKGKGKEAKLCFGGHALMENRHGLSLDIRISSALETEPEVAAALLHDVALAVGLASGWAQQHLDYSYERLKDQLTDDPGRFLANRPEGYHRTIVELWAQIRPSLTAATRELVDELAYLQTATVNLSVLGLADPDTLGELRVPAHLGDALQPAASMAQHASARTRRRGLKVHRARSKQHARASRLKLVRIPPRSPCE